MKRAITWAMLLLASAVAWGQGGAVENKIKELSEQGRQAALKNDPSFIEQNTTSDYTVVTGMGRVVTRDEIIQMRKNGDVKYESIEPSDLKVRTYGDTAVLTGATNVKGALKGKDFSGNYRMTQVWVKQGGKWKVASMQSTKVESQ